MATVEESTCPRCKTAGSLSIAFKLSAAPVGDFSLAGVMMKFSAQRVPVLNCTNCDLSHVGRCDPDGRHVLFDRAL